MTQRNFPVIDRTRNFVTYELGCRDALVEEMLRNSSFLSSDAQYESSYCECGSDIYTDEKNKGPELL